MDEIERIEEERFIESLICLWIQPDAPKWIIDYVRQELKKQRGLLEEFTDSNPDKEKVVKGLRCIKGDYIPCATCKYADADGYGRGDRCKRQCASDAIALLKEQDNCENCAIAIEDRQLVVRCIDCKDRSQNANG